MLKSSLFPWRWKALAAVLCLCLLTPVGKASEIAAPASPASKQTDAGGQETQASAQKTAAAAPQTLTEEEAAELAVRAEEPGPEVAGGALSNQHLTYIVIALAAAVIVLIAK